jgi:hypothetical protein
MPRSLPLAFALALGATLAAQSAPCYSMNDATNGVSGGITAAALSGPVSWGFQFTPTASQAIQSVQIYTENRFQARAMQLEIWSDASGLPSARLGGGSFKIQTAWFTSWRGTNFEQPVVMAANTPYWIVWIEPGGSRLPYDPAGTPLPGARRLTGGVWTAGTAQALKFRLFCGLLDDLNVSPFGPGCNGAGGIASTFTNHPPTIDNALFMVEGIGLPTATASILVLGVQPSWTPVLIPGGPPGCFLHTDPFVVLTGLTGNGAVNSPTGPSGHTAFGLPIPNVPTLAGLTLGLQVGALDTSFAVPVPIVTGNAVNVRLY